MSPKWFVNEKFCAGKQMDLQSIQFVYLLAQEDFVLVFLDLLMTFFCWILIGNPRLCESLFVHFSVYYLKSVGGKFEINFDGKIEIEKRLSLKILDPFRSNHIRIFSFHRLLTFLSLHSTSQLNFLIKFIGFHGQKFLVII